MPTATLCATLKKWKHGELVPKTTIELPAPISEAKLDRGYRAQYRRNRPPQPAAPQETVPQPLPAARKSDKLARLIPNPVLPWNLLGDHTKNLYGECSDRSIEERVGGDPQSVLGGDTARGLYESGPVNSGGSTAQQGTDGEGGAR